MPARIPLNNLDLARLDEGLIALDGVPSTEGKVLRFDLSDDVVWLVALNQVAVGAAVKATQIATRQLAAKYGVVEGMRVTPENAAQVAAYQSAIDALNAQVQEVELHKLKRADLQKAGVKIPGLLRNLMPVLE